MKELERIQPLLRGLHIPAWALVPAAIGLVSRLFSSGIIALMRVLGPPDYSVLVRPANGFDAWDGQWYLWIVKNGYHAAAVRPPRAFDFAFFPLWPSLIKVSTLGVLPSWSTAVVLANGLFIVAAVIVWRLLADSFGDVTATRATALFAFAPPAFVFSMVYTESLFVLLAAASLVAARRSSRWALPAAFLAGLSRVTSVAIAGSALVGAIRSTGRRRWIALGSVVAVLVALGAWSLFVWALTGDALGFVHVGTNWEPGTAGPQALLNYVAPPRVSSIPRIAFVVVIAVASLRLLKVDREIAAYSLGCVALAIAAGAVWSIPRYVLVAFPAFGVLAGWGGRRGTLVLLAISVALQVAFVWMSISPNPLEAM